MPPTEEDERQRQIHRNSRRTAVVLWLVVALIFCYMLAKYYWLNK
jgi:cytochrome c1